ncbi:MAG: DUF433 domain-containing protein [Betaproteobacteria bacterium]|nr:DUF433 domain-containing protein [Betaproteobacteria bacterium]
MPAYTVPEAAHYLGIAAPTLRTWVAGQSYTYRGEKRWFRAVIHLTDPKTHTLSFSNLVEAYVLTSMRRKHRIGLPTIRRALRLLTDRLGSKRPLLTEQFATNGVDLFVDRIREIINLTKDGQLEMAEMIRAYLERIERDAKGMPIKLYPFMRSQPPRDQPRTVVIDPRVSFGRPVIAGTGIPTAVLAERYKAGERIQDLAKDYGAPEEAIEDAIRCELELKAA